MFNKDSKSNNNKISKLLNIECPNNNILPGIMHL